jgi:hypothetical protein
MIDTILIASHVEGDHLAVSPIREFYLDLGLFLLLVGIHRGHIWDQGADWRWLPARIPSP